jgi:plasmid maintenance system antidote protein VapI
MTTSEARRSPTPSLSNSFRLRLQSELAERCANNQQYSLRSFALHLGIDHSTLSQLLRGKRKLTDAAIQKLGAALKLGPDEVLFYLAYHQRWPVADPGLDEATRLTRDAAEMIADWYHYAILELTRLESFRADSSWVARVLGISTDEVNIALVRLCHLGLLTMDGDRWVDRSEGLVVSMEDFTQTAIDRLWSQVQELSLASIRDPVRLHEHSSTTLAVHSKRLPEITEKIATFRSELLALLERDRANDYDDVYRLEINFFPITKTAPSKENDDG